MTLPVSFVAGRKRKGLVGFVDAAINQEAHWQFQFFGEPIGNIAWHEPLIAIEFSLDGELWLPLSEHDRPVNDKGYDISIAYEDEVDASDRQLYSVRWYNPEISPIKKYRFVVLPRKNQRVLYSAVFN